MSAEFASNKPTSGAEPKANSKQIPSASSARPYAKRLAALRAAKSPPCDCGVEAHHSADAAVGSKVAPPAHPKRSSAHSGHKGVGAIDSRGA